MTDKIQERIRKFREDIKKTLEETEKDILKSLEGKVIYFNGDCYVAYIFPDKVCGSTCDDGEELNDFEVRGYMLQLQLRPIPKFEVKYTTVNLEYPSTINPQAQIRTWNNDLKIEIVGILEKIILQQPINSNKEIDCWKINSQVYKKDDYFFMKAPPFILGKVLLFNGELPHEKDKKKEVVYAEKVKICDVMKNIEKLIFQNKTV